MKLDSKWVAQVLVKQGIVQLMDEKPFDFASKMLSPMKIELEKMHRLPSLRGMLLLHYVNSFASFQDYPSDTIIAGIAVGAVPFSAMLADRLSMQHLILRDDLFVPQDVKGRLVITMEDVVTEGASSFLRIKALLDRGARAKDIYSLASYDFPKAADRFKELGVGHVNLVPFSILFDAMEEHLPSEKVLMVREWHDNPWDWTGEMRARLDGQKVLAV